MRIERRRRLHGPSGKELARRRKAAGLTQVQLAEKAGIERHAVQYWEYLPGIDPQGYAVQRMARVLGWDLPDSRHDTRADEVIPEWAAEADAKAEAECFAMWEAAHAKAAKRRARALAKRRVLCGARIRKGTPCRNRSEPGKQRCKFHGGKSTGARTPEGIERIRQAQKHRWARWRGAKKETGSV